MNSTIIIDIQGFVTSNKVFTPKELAAFDGKKLAHYIFKPPFSFDCLPPHLKTQANYLINNHHCIRWESGFTPVHKFKDILNDITSSFDVIYVKGREKTEYLRGLTAKPIVECAEQPKISLQEPLCFYHSKTSCVCALTNVYNFYENFIMKE